MFIAGHLGVIQRVDAGYRWGHGLARNVIGLAAAALLGYQSLIPEPAEQGTRLERVQPGKFTAGHVVHRLRFPKEEKHFAGVGG